MRFDDIEVGLEYELKRAGRPIRVTALKTPEELRSRQRYRIRYEDGIKKGEVAEQPLRFIRSRWGKPPPSTPVETRTINKPAPWPPTPGDSVLWPETTGDIEWTVIEVDVEAATAHIDGELLSIKQGHTVSLSDLKPTRIPVDLRTNGKQQSAPPSRARKRVRRAPEREARSPLLDRLDFSEACLRQYHADFEPDIPWSQISSRLRRELRNHGRPIRRRPGEYVRLRTRRFDVSVMNRPTDDKPYLVEKLEPLKSQRRHRRSRKEVRGIERSG
jgi:hypothetical protein